MLLGLYVTLSHDIPKENVQDMLLLVEIVQFWPGKA